MCFFDKKIVGMKHKGNRGEMCVYRERKIREVFLKLKRSGVHSTIGEICKALAGMPMDRYYISEERARDIYVRYLRSGIIDSCSRYAYSLRLALVHECDRIRHEEGAASINFVVRKAIEQPAQSIGLSPSRIQRILKEGGLLG